VAFTLPEMSRLENACWAALIESDVSTLEQILAPDIIWVHSNAMVESKSTFIGHFKEGRVKYISVDRTEEQTRLYGDMAIITGIMDATAQAGGQLHKIRNRFTTVWIQTTAGPQIVSSQMTKVG